LKKNILIADSPNIFAEKIKGLLSNQKLYDKLRKNAIKLAESKYDWKMIAKNAVKDLNKF